MSLEVDDRFDDILIPHQHEGEGFKYINGQDTYESPYPSQDPYITGTARGYSQHQQPSKSQECGQGERLRVRPGSIFRWWFLFALIAALAVATADVIDSVAAKTRKNLDTWYVFAFPQLRPGKSTLMARRQYDYTAGIERDAQCEGLIRRQ